ncbi:MAG: TRAP transporter small permease subunit [Burkholderiales bacterium]|nr:MAG: TRAP transporter small permease subunit [Burkholderiales bacterium]
MGTITRLLTGLLRHVDRLSYVLIVVTMAAMAGLVSAQVFMRYVMGSSIDSADELSRLFFVWAIFLSIPQGVKFGIHVGIDLLVAQFGEHTRALLARAMAGFGAVLMAVVLYAAIIATSDKWQELMPTLNMTAAVYYIAVLICAAHSLLHLINQLLLGPEAVHRESF